MTLNDIQKEVISLGFEDRISDSTVFLSSVKRALSTIYTERGIHSELSFFKRSPKLVKLEEIFYTGEPLTYEIGRGAYSFFISGHGSFTFSDSDGTKTEYTFSNRKERFAGISHGSGLFKFSGANSYTVYRFSFFPDYLPYDTADIPTGEFKADYNLKSLAKDYLAAASMPTDDYGKEIPNCEICSSTLKIPYEYEGAVRLKYRIAPPVPSLDQPDRELVLEKETEHLIPLLTAAYMWLDDDSDKAVYYMQLYREGMAAVKLYNTRCQNNNYTDVLRWA